MAALIQIVKDRINSDLSLNKHIILLVPQSFLIDTQIEYQFKLTSNLEEASFFGKYIIRVSNEFHTGVTLGRLVQMIRNIQIVLGPSIPIRNPHFIPGLQNRQHFVPENPLNAVRIQVPIIEKIYWEVLKIYLEKFVFVPIRNPIKPKSMINQLTNLSQGLSISICNKGCSLVDEIPNSVQIANTIYYDLLENGAISEVRMSVVFNFQVLEAFFGVNPTLTFNTSIR